MRDTPGRQEYMLALKGALAGTGILLLAQLAVASLGLQVGFSRKVLASLAGEFGAMELLGLLMPSFALLVLLNLALVLVAFLLASCVRYARLGGTRFPVLVWIILLLLWLTVFWENARLYPSSSYASGLSVPSYLAGVPAGGLWLGLGVGCVMLGAWRRRHYPVLGSAAGVGLVVVLVPLLSGVSLATSRSGQVAGRPNVFIIGIDSVRIDRVGALGAVPSLTPNLDGLLANAAVFRTTYTPIARTYPSWMGILSGRHPLHSGARVNLMAQEGVDKQSLLPVAFRESGYRTVYAIDERRFSSIDDSYGFDEVVGPPAGVRDFLAQGFRDNPLLNLLVASGLGRYLLPYHHANRALDLTYKPKDFHALLQSAVDVTDHRPLFMTTHFCLPHWPYKWGEEEALHDAPLAHYHSALRRADRQVAAFVRELESHGYLDNAILVLLSDHGEAHGLPADLPYRLEGRPMAAAWGHGTDVLSPIQNRVVLGFVGFGLQAEKVRRAHHDDLVTLLDVAPTVASLAGINLPWQVDGRSLAGLLQGQAGLPASPVFLESEFDLPGVSQANPDVRRLVAAGIGYYHLTSEGRVELTGGALASIIDAKQRAVIEGDMMLAIYPHHEKARMLLVNQTSGEAREMGQASCRTDAACSQLLSRLEGFYGDEIRANPLMPWGTAPQ